MEEPADRAATRAGYDAIAAPYTELFGAELSRSVMDRAVVGAFAEMVGDSDVLDAGCGPGEVSAHLHRLGTRVHGIDLSPAMVEIARRTYAGIPFEVGDMAALDVPDGALGGVVAWYSLIHIPPPELPAVVRGFRRVLRPGGHLLLGFQIGDDVSHHDEAFGHRVSLAFRRLQPDDVVALLESTGFDVVARVVRPPEPGSAASRTPQGALIARRPGLR